MARKARSTRKSSPSERTGAAEVLRWLERKGTKKQIAELPRYGIVAERPFGVRVGDLKKYAKELGTDHELALELWETGRYEARLLASMVADPQRLTVAQMNAWVAGFDSWAVVDTVCFVLFDRSRHAWKKVARWAKARPLYVRRAGFALLWSLALHDREAEDEAFLRCLPLLEKGAEDERDMVEKAVDMALRAVGKRSERLHAAAMELAGRLAESEQPVPRRIGRHCVRELGKSGPRATSRRTGRRSG